MATASSLPSPASWAAGTQRTYVKCECSKCQGLVMCGARELLPSAVTPSHYALELAPDLEAFTYTGKVVVELTVNAPCNAVTFHAKELDVKCGHVVDAAGEPRTNPEGKDVLYGEKDQETCTVALAYPFTEADVGKKATLTIEFTGELNDKLAGFYRSKYTAPGGEARHLAVTQFEPTDARRCFPCWDEPSIKATFDVTLTVPADRVCLSNMPEKSVTEDGDKKTVSFQTTPIMSTYLLCFVVGEFEAVTSATKEGVEVRCWMPVGEAEKGRFALDVACKTLSFFGEYFDKPYPLPKMDMIAVPDFSAGAMENWGLVTYRSSLLLCDETTPVNVKQRIGYVVGHELAHQWFGNLVTMDWWEGLWLNEGFATWVGWRAMDELFPEWRVWSQFLANEMGMGLNLDSLKSSHPIEVPIAKSQQVTEIFDAISYSKGACVIRMLEAYLGEEQFRAGMRTYVQRHAFGNTETGDLWKALSESSGKDVAALMSCWTRQTGFPVLSVAVDGGEMSVTQRRFLASGPEEAAAGEQWIVPLRAEGLPDALEGASLTVPLPASGVPKLNSRQSGFYRTVYTDAATREALVAKLPTMPEQDRVGVVSDAFACASAGFASTTNALDLLSAYGGEESFVVWSEISSGLGAVISAFFEQPDEVVEGLTAYAGALYAPVVAKVGWDQRAEDTHADAMLRQLVVSRALAVREPTAVAEAQKRFAAYVGGDAKAIPSDVKAATFAAAMRAGGPETLAQLKELHAKATSAVEESMLLSAMGAGPSKELVIEALEYNLTDAVRMQDGASIVASCAGNRVGRRATWEWSQANWERLEGRFGGGGVSSILTRIVGSCCSSLASDADATAVEAFFQAHPTPGTERTVAQCAEAIRARAKRLSRDADAVAAWIKKQ